MGQRSCRVSVHDSRSAIYDLDCAVIPDSALLGDIGHRRGHRAGIFRVGVRVTDRGAEKSRRAGSGLGRSGRPRR